MFHSLPAYPGHVLTRRTIVAHRKVLSYPFSYVFETVRASLRVAADGLGVFPDDLGEMTPVLEVGHVR